MSYFHILQVSIPDQIKLIGEDYQISIPASRFLEYTDENIRIFFKIITEENLVLLNRYPAIITIERFEKEIILAKIKNTIYNNEEQNILVNFEKLESINIMSYDDVEITEEDTKETKRAKFKRIDDDIKSIKEALKFEALEEYRNHWSLKKGDIFSISSQNRSLESFNNDNFIILFPDYKTQLPLTQYIDLQVNITTDSELQVNLDTVPSVPPAHQEDSNIFISNVSDYISKINQLSGESGLDNREVFYRGHSNAKRYFLQPSLFRQYKDKGLIYLNSERNSFMDLLTTEPKEFGNESRCFDILTHMQHYSFPTRLLDISSNPLAALYFSCEIKKNDKGEEIDIDGEVIIFSIKKSEIKYFDSDSVSCLTNLAKLSEDQKIDLSDYIDKVSLNTPNRLEFNSDDCEENLTYSRYIHFIRQEKPYFEPKVKIADLKKVICVKGRLTQDRIIAQAGSFLLYGLDSKLPEEGNDIFRIDRIKIKSSDKKNLLNELDLLKVNLRTIYPSLENTAKYLKEKLEREADSK